MGGADVVRGRTSLEILPGRRPLTVFSRGHPAIPSGAVAEAQPPPSVLASLPSARSTQTCARASALA